MAASLEDVVANTGATDPSHAMGWCRPAYAYERARSEIASKYMAGLIMFNFLWSAFENARELSEFGVILTGRPRNKGPQLRALTSGLSDDLPLFRQALFDAMAPCRDDGELGRELDKLKIGDDASYAEIAADLLRRCRHYLFHGKDAVPEPDDWADDDDGDVGRVLGEDPREVTRLFTLSRLLALMVQVMAFSCLTDRRAPVYDNVGEGFEDVEAGWQLTVLHLDLPDHESELLPFPDMPCRSDNL